MLGFRSLKKISGVLAFLGVFALGYLAFSVSTSCRVDAATCGCDEDSSTEEMSECLVPSYMVIQGVEGNQVSTIETWMELVEDYAEASKDAMVEYIAELTIAYTGIPGGIKGRMQIKTTQVEKNMKAWWDSFWWYNLRPAMQDMTTQLAIANTNQAQMLGQIEDAADTNRTIRDMQKQEVESRRDNQVSESSCVAATTSAGMTRAASFRKAYNAAAPVEKSYRGGNSSAPAAGYSGAASKGKSADQKERWDKYVSKYCNPAANGGVGGCNGNNTTVGTLGADRDLDVIAEVFAKDTINIKDADTKTIVDDLLENIAEPFVPDNIPPSALDSPAGQETYLKLEAYKAKRQAIYDALYHVVARRIPGSRPQNAPANTNFVKTLRDSAGITGSMLSDNPSYNEIMEVMMSERFRTGKYSIEQIDDPKNNEKEIVVQLAFEAMQLSDMLDLMDRYSLVLAAQTGAEIAETKPFDSKLEDTKKR